MGRNGGLELTPRLPSRLERARSGTRILSEPSFLCLRVAWKAFGGSLPSRAHDALF